jgi:hypothetical protein
VALYRDEFNKLVIRLSLIRNSMIEDGYPETAKALTDVITGLNNVDQTYIRELAKKKYK